jgi:MioC protein
MLVLAYAMSYIMNCRGRESAPPRDLMPKGTGVNAVTILVGTMTGTAELVANDLRDAIAATGREAEVLAMDNLEPDVFQRAGVFLFCCSTYGQGDVPDNALKFYEALGAQAPALAHVRYGVFALGDRTYADTFCHGGKRFDELMARLDASRIGEVMRHDASAGTMPEEVALEWLPGWLQQLEAVETQAA